MEPHVAFYTIGFSNILSHSLSRLWDKQYFIPQGFPLLLFPTIKTLLPFQPTVKHYYKICWYPFCSSNLQLTQWCSNLLWEVSKLANSATRNTMRSGVWIMSQPFLGADIKHFKITIPSRNSPALIECRIVKSLRNGWIIILDPLLPVKVWTIFEEKHWEICFYYTQ